jgi:hypothetical protein
MHGNPFQKGQTVWVRQQWISKIHTEAESVSVTEVPALMH